MTDAVELALIAGGFALLNTAVTGIMAYKVSKVSQSVDGVAKSVDGILKGRVEAAESVGAMKEREGSAAIAQDLKVATADIAERVKAGLPAKPPI